MLEKLRRLVAKALQIAGTIVLDGFRIGGVFVIECRDAQGNLVWRDMAKNLVTNEGLNHLLNVAFHGSSQTATWYMGLINSSPSYAASDTMASHSGWTEFTGYSGDRKEWAEGAASGQQISNSGNPASFSVTQAGTIAGAFLCSAASGSTAVLYCEANFSQGDRPVADGYTLNGTYTLTGQDDGV